LSQKAQILYACSTATSYEQLYKIHKYGITTDGRILALKLWPLDEAILKKKAAVS
jgi:hypothetical protein